MHRILWRGLQKPVCLSFCNCVVLLNALGLAKSLQLRVTTGSHSWSNAEGFSQLLLCEGLCHVGKRLSTVFWKSIPVNWVSRDSWEQNYIAWHINFVQISGGILLLRQYIYLLLSLYPHIKSFGLLGIQNLMGSSPSTQDIVQLLFCPFLYSFSFSTVY